MSTFTDLEKDAASVDGFVSENGLIPTRRNGPKPSYQYLVDGWNAEISATILELNKSRGFRVVGTFEDGFTYELFNDVGIDADGNSWIYVGAGAPNKVVAAGTVPSVSAGYEQVTFNSASDVQSNTGSVQDFIDSFELKVFQSPTTLNTTLIESYTKQPNQVFEVRKTSDDTLATVYSNESGTVELVQNGVDNKSNANGEIVFYIDDGEYYIGVAGVSSLFSVIGSNLIARHFPSVDAMKNESLPVGVIVNTTSYIQGAGKGAGSYKVEQSGGQFNDKIDHVLANGNVAVLMNEGALTPYQAGAVGDGVSDDILALEAARDAGATLNLTNGVFGVSRTFTSVRGKSILGSGVFSVLKGLNVSGGVFVTYPMTGTVTHPQQKIQDFCISGTADYACGITHCTRSVVKNIQLGNGGAGGSESFSGTDGFILEYFFGTTVSNLSTDGATLTGTPYKINKVVLDSELDLFYTSNLTDYSIVIDSQAVEISTGVDTGFGTNTMRLPTVQGANKYGIWLKNCNDMTFETIYSENCKSTLLITGSTSDITFIGGNLEEIRAASTTHDIWIDGVVSGVTFINTSFSNKEHVIGNVSSDIVFISPRITGGGSFFSGVKRTNDTPSSMPVFIQEQVGSSSKLVMKTDNFAWQFGEMTLTNQSGNAIWNSPPVSTPSITANVKN